VYRTRRRRALLVAVVALLAVTTFAAPGHLLGGKDHSSRLDGHGRSYLSTHGWPLSGQGAYVLGNGRPAVSPHQRPVPIASVVISDPVDYTQLTGGANDCTPSTTIPVGGTCEVRIA